MNIYEVTYERWGKTEAPINVLAKDTTQAIEHTRRHLKKNYMGSAEITRIDRVLKVNVVYKS